MKRPSTRRSTIEDVARKAGLSVSTVSLVLNNKANVRKETRKKVQAVIAELDYHPQRSARGLATQSSGNIGFILTEDHFSHAEPFYTKIFLGSELEARQHNYYILLTTVASSVHNTKEMPRFFLERNVDGIIVAGKIGSSWIEYICDMGLPVILIDYELPRHRLSAVTADNSSGARLVVEHLLKLGHTKIGFLGADLKHPSIAERYNAYRDTLAAHDVAVAQSWISTDEPTPRLENGYHAARRMLGGSAARPTALFAANDALALGCMKFCKESEIPIPDALAVVGFDNIESGLLVEPRLTTVNVHREEMGSIAVRRLVEMIRDKSNLVNRTTTQVELVIRESSGARRQSAPVAKEVLALAKLKEVAS
ncbi:MAG: LacI family DNA-binding transcriptional regulator [Bacteroidota bacterium]